MKAIILSVSAGGGHIHAAEAIKSYILENDSESEIHIIDTLKYINPIIDKVVIGSYLNTLKITPSLYGKIYAFAEAEDGLATVSNKLNELLAYKLLRLMREIKPDILICTHFFPAEMLSTLKVKHKIDIPAITVITDYYSHNFWIQPQIESYIVSSNDMIDQLTSKGIEKDSIHNIGIPVHPSFMNKYDKNETLKELGLSTYKVTILIMGGSLGIGNIMNIYENIVNINSDIQIIVITGKNKKLYTELKKLQENSLKPTRVIGFTDEVNKYMQACDLLLTKPGGLTITEALICNTPIAIFSPIPGQEEKNAEFLLKHKLAINLGDGKYCGSIIENLLNSKNALETIKENCKHFSRPNSGDKIYEVISSLIQKQNSIK